MGITILKYGDQWLDGTNIAELSKCPDHSHAHDRVGVLECADERIDGATVAEPSECPGGLLAHARSVLSPQLLNHPGNIICPFRPPAIRSPSDGFHDYSPLPEGNSPGYTAS